MSTIMAPLTPIQISPVIILRVSGPGCKDILSLFEIKGELRSRYSVRAIYRSKSEQELSDDILMTYYENPHSFTGEDVLELSFHGNPVIVSSAMKDFSDFGVRLAEPGEFTRRAYLANKITLAQAEAIDAIIHAHTAQGVKGASAGLYGEMDLLFNSLRDALIFELANLEVMIDFSEEVSISEENRISDKVSEALNIIEKLINNYNRDKMARKGVQVVIVGEPNSGKSTLFNALLGEERAIVTEEAGTTRDVLREMLQAGGVNLVLADTAGVRKSDSVAENIGVERTMDEIQKADLVLLLLDQSVEIGTESSRLLKIVENKPHIVIGSKMDKGSKHFSETDIDITIKSEESIARLKGLLAEKVQNMLGNFNEKHVLTSERQYLECSACAEALKEFNKEHSMDIQAYHLRKAVECLNSLQGIDVSEAALNVIFSRFCIGK